MQPSTQRKEITDHEILNLVTTLAANGELNRLKNLDIMTDEERSAEIFRQQKNGYDLDTLEKTPDTLFEASMQLRKHHSNIEADRKHRPNNRKKPFVSGINTTFNGQPASWNSLFGLPTKESSEQFKFEQNMIIQRLLVASHRKLAEIGLTERITESADTGTVSKPLSADSRLRIMLNKAKLTVQKDNTVYFGRRKIGQLHNFTLSPDGTTIADRGRKIWQLGDYKILEDAGGVVKRRDTKNPVPCPECGSDLLNFNDQAICERCSFKMPMDKSNKLYAVGRTVLVAGTANAAG